MKFLLREDFADGGHFEVEDQAEDGRLYGGGDDLADDGQVDRGEEKVGAVAEVRRLADDDSFLSLGEDDEAGLVCSRGAGGGNGAAIEAQARNGSGQSPSASARFAILRASSARL